MFLGREVDSPKVVRRLQRFDAGLEFIRSNLRFFRPALQSYDHSGLQWRSEAAKACPGMREVNRMRQVVDGVESNFHRQHHFSAWRGALVQHGQTIILRQPVTKKLREVITYIKLRPELGIQNLHGHELHGSGRKKWVFFGKGKDVVPNTMRREELSAQFDLVPRSFFSSYFHTYNFVAGFNLSIPPVADFFCVFVSQTKDSSRDYSSPTAEIL